MKESKSTALLNPQQYLTQNKPQNQMQLNQAALNQQLMAFIQEKENINQRLQRNPSAALLTVQNKNGGGLLPQNAFTNINNNGNNQSNNQSVKAQSNLGKVIIQSTKFSQQVANNQPSKQQQESTSKSFIIQKSLSRSFLTEQDMSYSQHHQQYPQTDPQNQTMSNLNETLNNENIEMMVSTSNQSQFRTPVQRVKCIYCKSNTDLVQYECSASQDLFGSCQKCGTFINATKKVQSIKMKNTDFKVDIPMDEMLQRMIERQTVCKIFNPAAVYVKKRRVIVDWMCEMGEDLKYDPEAIHHSIAVFDAYFSLANIEQHLFSLKLTEGRSFEQVIQLVAVVCMLISAKFLEKTYPGVQKLNSIIQSPFSYDEFIFMEKDILETLNWEIYIVTPFLIIQHFISQGVLFTNDEIEINNQVRQVSLQNITNVQKFAEFYTEMCLQDHSFLQYDSFTLACGIIMASRKMIRVKEKWPQELYLMTGMRKKVNQIKRCMTHIFEFYEETFPDHSLSQQDTQVTSNINSQDSSQKSTRNTGYNSGNPSSDKQVRFDLQKPSNFTTPTDNDTPKEIVEYKPQIIGNSRTDQITGEKVRQDNKRKSGGLVSGLYYAQVKQMQQCQSKDKLRITQQEVQLHQNQQQEQNLDISESYIDQSLVTIAQNEQQPVKKVSINMFNGSFGMGGLTMDDSRVHGEEEAQGQFRKMKSTLSRYNSVKNLQNNEKQMNIKRCQSRQQNNSFSKSRNVSFVQNQSFRNPSTQRTNFQVQVPQKPILKCRRRLEGAEMPQAIQNQATQSIKKQNMSFSRERSISNMRPTSKHNFIPQKNIQQNKLDDTLNQQQNQSNNKPIQTLKRNISQTRVAQARKINPNVVLTNNLVINRMMPLRTTRGDSKEHNLPQTTTHKNQPQLNFNDNNNILNNIPVSMPSSTKNIASSRNKPPLLMQNSRTTANLMQQHQTQNVAQKPNLGLRNGGIGISQTRLSLNRENQEQNGNNTNRKQ